MAMNQERRAYDPAVFDLMISAPASFCFVGALSYVQAFTVFTLYNPQICTRTLNIPEH